MEGAAYQRMVIRDERGRIMRGSLRQKSLFTEGYANSAARGRQRKLAKLAPRLAPEVAQQKIRHHIETQGITFCPAGVALGVRGDTITATGLETKPVFIYRKDPVQHHNSRLAHAKILCMILSLVGNYFGTGSLQDKLEGKKEAIEWIFKKEHDEDFAEWCCSANLNPDYVRRKAKTILEDTDKYAGTISTLMAAAVL